MPQYLLELFDGAQIAVTQPRRMAAINLAKRVAKERGEALGETVGYRIGGDSAVGRGRTTGGVSQKERSFLVGWQRLLTGAAVCLVLIVPH